MITAFLQEGFGIQTTFGLGEYGKNRADGNIDIDIGRAVQRVEQDEIAAVFVGCYKSILFLACQTGDMGVFFQDVNQDIVGNHIQLFLIFALNIARTRHAQHAGECAQADFAADVGAGGDNGFKDAAQFGRNAVLL